MAVEYIIISVIVGIPLAFIIFIIGWTRGASYHDNFLNWSHGYGSGWDAGWDLGFEVGYRRGLQRLAKEKERLKEQDKEPPEEEEKNDP